MADFFSRPVVCNTGPIIGLSRAGLCHLPGEIFPGVLIPDAVVTKRPARMGSLASSLMSEKPGGSPIRSSGWRSEEPVRS